MHTNILKAALAALVVLLPVRSRPRPQSGPSAYPVTARR
jgi:hypothetical protein